VTGQEIHGSLLDAAAHAECASPEEIAPGGVLVLAPHPDDETLGCGQAIAAACAIGRRVGIALVTGGENSHPGSLTHPRPAMRELRRREFCRAIQALGNGTIESVELGFPDGKLECRDGVGIADQLRTFADDLRPSVIWASWSGDPHCDHIATAVAAEILGSRLGIPIWSYAVWGRFADRCVPSLSRLRRFDRPEWRRKKAEAMQAYRSQMGEVVHDDPDGFSLTPETAAHFRDAPEILIREAAL